MLSDNEASEMKSKLDKPGLDVESLDEILGADAWELPLLLERDEYMTSLLWAAANKESNEANVTVPIFAKNPSAGLFEFALVNTTELMEPAKPVSKVVAIVGSNHMPGMVKLWKDRMDVAAETGSN